MSNSQLHKLKSSVQNRTEVTLNFSSIFFFENSNYATNFTHKVLLIDTQVWNICNEFANGSSAIISFSKTQLSEIQSGGFAIYEIIGPLLKAM